MTNKQWGKIPEEPPRTYIILRTRKPNSGKWVKNLTLGVIYDAPEKVQEIIEKALNDAYGEAKESDR